VNERLQRIIRHPLTHIALLGLTGLPLSCTRSDQPTTPDNNIDGVSVVRKATVLPEVLAAAKKAENTDTKPQIEAVTIWINLFRNELTNSAKTATLRFSIAQQLQVKGNPFTAVDLIQGLVPMDQTILTVTSNLTDNSPAGGYRTAGSGARRMLGITQIRGMQIESKLKALTLEQQANNVKQAGTVTLTFLARGAYSIWDGKDAYSYKAPELAKTPPTPNLSDSTPTSDVPWRKQERTIDLATGEISGHKGDGINNLLRTPVDIMIYCPQAIQGFAGEQTCLTKTK
jgi:hypothetical protein